MHCKVKINKALVKSNSSVPLFLDARFWRPGMHPKASPSPEKLKCGSVSFDVLHDATTTHSTPLSTTLPQPTRLPYEPTHTFTMANSYYEVQYEDGDSYKGEPSRPSAVCLCRLCLCRLCACEAERWLALFASTDCCSGACGDPCRCVCGLLCTGTLAHARLPPNC